MLITFDWFVGQLPAQVSVQVMVQLTDQHPLKDLPTDLMTTFLQHRKFGCLC